MTDRQKEYAEKCFKFAASIIHGHYASMERKNVDSEAMVSQIVAFTSVLLQQFPMPYVQPAPPEEGELTPDRPGKWAYQKQGGQGMMTVEVDCTGGTNFNKDELLYFNQDADRWVKVSLAQGQWGGYVGPLT